MNDAEAPNAAEAGSHSVSPACLCALLGCACVSVAVRNVQTDTSSLETPFKSACAMEAGIVK